MAEELKKRVVRRAGGLAYDLTNPQRTYIYELARADDGVCFCCFDGKRFFRLDQIEQIDHVIFPPPENKVTWPLPRLIEGTGNPPDKHLIFARQVWDGVRQFIYDHLDLTDERYYTYLTAWIFASWFQDKPLSASPYPYFTGLKRSGKSRALEVLRSLSFRAKGLAGVTGAAIRTNIRLLQPTLLIDEADFEDEEKYGELYSVLLSYRPDMYVERKNPKASGWEQLEVDPAFCFKAIASRKPPNTNLADRCVIIHMQYRSRKVKKINSKESQARAEKLRTELMEVRMRHYGEISDVDVDLGLEDDRVEELFAPIYVMARTFAGEKEAQEIISLARDVEASFEKERRRSDAKDIIEAICLLVDEGKAEKKLGKYVLPTSMVLEKVNESRHESMKMSARLQASILDSLGFERDDVRYGEKGRTMKCIVFEERTLEHYKKLFKIGEAETEPAVEEGLIKTIRDWLKANKDETGQISLTALTDYLQKELKLDPVKTIKKLFDEGLIAPSPEPGKAVVA